MFKRNLLLFSLSLSLFFPTLTFAAPLAESSPPATDINSSIFNQLNAAGSQTGLGSQDPRVTAARIVNLLLQLLGTIFLIYIVYAGFLWMTAGGEEEKIKKAQSHLKNGIIGLVIILSAYAITLMVTQLLYKTTVNKYYQVPPGQPSYWPQGGL